MGGTARRVRPGDHPAVNPRLLELLERDELDWDNPVHREAYLKAWVNGELPGKAEEDLDRPDATLRI